MAALQCYGGTMPSRHKRQRTRGRASRGRTPPHPDRLRRTAEALEAAGDPGAQVAWRALAERLRTTDRPVAALAALRRSSGGDSLEHALTAGILQDLGLLEPARIEAERARSTARSDSARAVALDVLAGVCLALGEVEQARELVGTLRAEKNPAASLSASVREARLLRLDGDLTGAAGLLSSVEAALPTRGAVAAARASVVAQRAELLRLAGDLDGAHGAASAALRLLSASDAERRAPVFAMLSLQARVALDRGDAVVASSLDPAVAYAAERELRLLHAELLLTRGLCQVAVNRVGAAQDIDQAVVLAKESGARLLEGRVRLRRRQAGLPAAPGDRSRTQLLLAPDRLLSRTLATLA